MNKQFVMNMIHESKKRRSSPATTTKKLILHEDDLDSKEIERRKVLKKTVLTSRNEHLDSKISLKKFVVHALRKKSNPNFGKNSLNIPPYLLEEMKRSHQKFTETISEKRPSKVIIFLTFR